MSEVMPPHTPSSFEPPVNPKPGLVMAIAIMTLVDGVLNVVWGAGLALGLIATILGIICAPLAVYPMLVGILGIIYGARLLSDPPEPVQPAKYLAVMQICNILYGNVLSLVIGILALVFYNDASVRAYFSWLNKPPTAAGR